MVKLIRSDTEKTSEMSNIANTIYSYFQVECNDNDCTYMEVFTSLAKTKKGFAKHAHDTNHSVIEISFHTGLVVNE